MPERIDDCRLIVRRDTNRGMNTNVRIYANEYIAKYMERDRTLQQAVNATTLPGIVGDMLVMPDGHEGYGFPVGGVIAFDAVGGIVSPGICGFDINCGVRIIKTNLEEKDLKPNIRQLADALFKSVPSGVGSRMNTGMGASDLDRIALEGAPFAISKGYGFAKDAEHMEENGCISGSDPDRVSDFAKKRGLHEVGTLGAGNHFLEVQKVEKVADQSMAKAFGLHEGMVVVMLHSGSRGYGHQICSDYLERLSEYQRKNGIKLVDPELSYAPIGSREADDYLAAMRCAVNFAFTNRQVMTDSIRKAFEQTFSKSADALGMELLYDLAHNIVKEEEHVVDGARHKLLVHRKGATRAFGPGRDEIPRAYRDHGQPVLIPGSMGTASYVLSGRSESLAETFGSSCHGSGRLMSRHQAIREIPAAKTLGSMSSKGVELRVHNRSLVSEEAEWAYKDVDEVVACVAGAKISNIVARLVPLAVAKG